MAQGNVPTSLDGRSDQRQRLAKYSRVHLNVLFTIQAS